MFFIFLFLLCQYFLDLNEEKINLYKSGIDPTKEVGDEVIRNTEVEFTADASKLKEAKFHIVAVPTPVKSDHTPDLSPVEGASHILGQNLTKGSVVVFIHERNINISLAVLDDLCRFRYLNGFCTVNTGIYDKLVHFCYRVECFLIHTGYDLGDGFQPMYFIAWIDTFPGRRINDEMGKYVAESLVKNLIKADIPVKTAKVAILGFTFKENCPDTRNTKVIDIYNELGEYGICPLVVDPAADLCSAVL